VRLLQHLLQERSFRSVVYLDADNFCVGPLAELPSLLAKHQIVLTPQITAPFPPDLVVPSEFATLSAGIFNSGFLGVSQGEEAFDMLSWWWERTQRFSFRRPEEGMFADQKWLDFIPGMYQSVAIIQDPAYNAAFWNLHERPLEVRNGEFFVRGKRAAFFHMSNFSPGSPPAFCRDTALEHFASEPAAQTLAEAYQRALEENEFSGTHNIPYAYDSFKDGTTISPIIRRIYEMVEDRPWSQDPFSVGPGSFREWLTSPATDRRNSAGLTNFQARLAELSVEASILYPDACNRDATRFAEWLLSSRQQRMFRLDPPFLPPLHTLAARNSYWPVKKLLEARHSWKPYQMLCAVMRAFLGKRLYDTIKPKRRIESAEPLLMSHEKEKSSANTVG
jgi:hypothetical protein